MVAVDSAGKCSHFIETVTTVTAAGEANLYLRNIDTQIAIVFESPVPGLEKDRDWTRLGPIRTGNPRTAKDRNRGPVHGPLPFPKFQDRTKTGLDQSGPVCW